MFRSTAYKPSRTFSRHSQFKRAFLAWLVLIATEIIHGTLRTIFLVPVVGEFGSRQMGVFTGQS